MRIRPAPSRLCCLAGISMVALAPRQVLHALGFSSPAPTVSKANRSHRLNGTVRNLKKLSRRREEKGSGSATPSGPVTQLKLNLSQGGDVGSGGDGGTQNPGGGGEGANFREPGAADGDSLLAGQAHEALEFWRNRRPSPTLPPTQVIGLLMAALQKNDNPNENDGLRTVFEFSSGMCRRAVGGTADSFIKGARFSVFGATVGCQSFRLDPMQIVGDRLATQVVSVVASDGRQRRFLWTLERQRRPPDAGKWLIYGVLSSDVDGKLNMEG